MKWTRACAVALLPLLLAGCFAGVSKYPTSGSVPGEASSPPMGVPRGAVIAPGLYVQSGGTVEAVGLLVKRSDGTWVVLKTTDASQAASATVIATLAFDKGMLARMTAARNAYVSVTGSWATGGSASPALTVASVSVMRSMMGR